MGRPRQYASAAERQRAYRERLDEEMVCVNRRGLERLEARLEELHQAVRTASQAGNAVARACNERSIEGMLAKMADYFTGQAMGGESES
jgi:predicted HAD superfamily Cof-like phosphohydrolase